MCAVTLALGWFLFDDKIKTGIAPLLQPPLPQLQHESFSEHLPQNVVFMDDNTTSTPELGANDTLPPFSPNETDIPEFENTTLVPDNETDLPDHNSTLNDTDSPNVTKPPDTDMPTSVAPLTDAPPTDIPTGVPTAEPTSVPTDAPTEVPLQFNETDSPMNETDTPTFNETDSPMNETDTPTFNETDSPMNETDTPTFNETDSPANDTDSPANETDTPANETETGIPETDVPETDAPDTDAPETDAPQTDPPETSGPTLVPTDAPNTIPPTAPPTDPPAIELTDPPEVPPEAWVAVSVLLYPSSAALNNFFGASEDEDAANDRRGVLIDLLIANFAGYGDRLPASMRNGFVLGTPQIRLLSAAETGQRVIMYELSYNATNDNATDVDTTSATSLWNTLLPLFEALLLDGCYNAVSGSAGVASEDIMSSVIATSFVETSSGKLKDFAMPNGLFSQIRTADVLQDESSAASCNAATPPVVGCLYFFDWVSSALVPPLDGLFEVATGSNLTIVNQEQDITGLTLCEVYVTAVPTDAMTASAHTTNILNQVETAAGTSVRSATLIITSICTLNDTDGTTQCVEPSVLEDGEHADNIAQQQDTVKNLLSSGSSATQGRKQARHSREGDTLEGERLLLKVNFSVAVPLRSEADPNLGLTTRSDFTTEITAALACAGTTPTPPSEAPSIFSPGNNDNRTLGVVLALSLLGGCAMIILVIGLQWKKLKLLYKNMQNKGKTPSSDSSKPASDDDKPVAKKVKGATEPTHGDGQTTECPSIDDSINKCPEEDWLVVYDPYMPAAPPDGGTPASRTNWDVHSNDGRPYYYNTATGQTRWDTPTSLREIDRSEIASLTETHRELPSDEEVEEAEDGEEDDVDFVYEGEGSVHEPHDDSIV